MLLITTAFVFGLSRAAGDPRYLYLSEYTTMAEWEQWGEKMGLNRPLIVQYADWLWHALRLDFGQSLVHKRDAFELIVERGPASLKLAGASFFFAMITAIPLGVLSATRRGTVFDYVGRTLALLGQAMPGFWLGIVLIMIFSVNINWFPTGRQENGLMSYVLPALTLGWGPLAGMLRLVRSSMLEVLEAEFVKLARAKGVSTNVVIWKHVFRNALITPLTYGSLLLAGLLTGAVVVETVFAWPGLGRLGVQAVNANDFPLMVAIVLMTGVVFVAANLLVDILYAVIDPRIRYE